MEGQDHLRRPARTRRRRRCSSASRDKFGDDYNEALAKQELVLSRDIGNDERRVARGEYPMRIPQLFSTGFKQLKSLPVKVDRAGRGPALHPLRLRDAEGRAASECGAAVHQPLSQRAGAGGLCQCRLIPVVAGVLDKAVPEGMPAAAGDQADGHHQTPRRNRMRMREALAQADLQVASDGNPCPASLARNDRRPSMSPHLKAGRWRSIASI